MYRIGLDIGIGSVGWAVVANNGINSYIEDFGVRIFDSGENIEKKKTFCQERRGFRGTRRLIRRRLYRKILLKNLLESKHFLTDAFNDEMEDLTDVDVYGLKVKGLTEKLSEAELYKCLIHTCNHRGYRDFYDSDDENDKSEEGKNKKAVRDFGELYKSSGAPSVSAFLVSQKSGNFVDFRNRKDGSSFLLINRKDMQDEMEKILDCQQKYYPLLDDAFIQEIIDVIFAQRTFEDGPGKYGQAQKDIKYYGFLETLGQCSFYPEEKRGFKCTVISDVYGIVNTLSQYKYSDKTTGELRLPKEAANEIIDFFLINANLTSSDLKKILAKYNTAVNIPESCKKDAIQKSIHYLKSAKQAVESAGESWDKYISEDQLNPENPSLLHKIGEVLSQYQTPKYRKEKLVELLGNRSELIQAFSRKKCSGTSRVSYKYMADAIEAFKNGEIYGNFQASFNKQLDETADELKAYKLSPKCIDDEDVKKNRVVFKAINETRKIVNAIIDVYGSPNEIVIEVADELGTGFGTRMEEKRRMDNLEKENDLIRENVAEILGVNKDDSQVNGMAIDKYRLYEQQRGKCPYCGNPLGDETLVVKEGKSFEVDHIVPFSLILDNTLNNKVLVHTECNQYKGQRTPLEYLQANAGKQAAYKAFVNELFTRKEKPISKKKYEYMTCPSVIYAAENGMLDAWKSRNINDTRYITKYVVGMFKKYLKFGEGEYEKSEHVIAVKGAVTSKFRRIWLRDADKWGAVEKDRKTYLNHACDAVVLANLTRPYIELGSDSIRLRSLWKKYQSKSSAEYENFKDECIERMHDIYGFDENYTLKLLYFPNKIPSFIPDLRGEVLARFVEDEKELEKSVEYFYKGKIQFIRQPHVPIASLKQNNKFIGAISDSIYIRVEKVNDEMHKISRNEVKKLSESDLSKLYGADEDLTASLHGILDGKGREYTVEKYLAENGLKVFKTQKGQPVRMVSIDNGVISNYYEVDKGRGGKNKLGGLKYYTVDIYRDSKGNLCSCGVRYVDIVKKDGKLYQKPESRPIDYQKHETYLFKNDFIVVTDQNDKVKYSGYYKSVKNINRGDFYFSLNPNRSETLCKGFTKKDKLFKINIGLLGDKGGIIKCSEPYPLLPEKK